MPDLDTRLLAAVLGRLGSDHEGEIIAAARKAQAMVTAAGMTWAQALSHQGVTKRADANQGVLHPTLGVLVPPVGDTWVSSVNWLCAHRAGRDARENAFLDRLSMALTHPILGAVPAVPDAAEKVIEIYRHFTDPTFRG